MGGAKLLAVALSILGFALGACDPAPRPGDTRGVSGRGLAPPGTTAPEKAEPRERWRGPEDSPRPSRRSTASTAEPGGTDAGTRTGAPSRAEELVRTVEESARPVVDCLSAHGSGAAEARVGVRFEVSASGRVSRAEVEAPPTSPLAKCVARAAEAVRFPRGPAVRFRYEYRVRRGDAGTEEVEGPARIVIPGAPRSAAGGRR